MKNDKKYYFILLLSFTCLVSPALTVAEGITARYLENSDMNSILEMIIENPPPTSIIVKQHLPVKTRIVKAIPSATKFVADKGEVTWLFKAPSPGVQYIRLQYEKSLSGGKAIAVIRCKSPRDGKLVTIHAQ
jgi:hypothetical protein